MISKTCVWRWQLSNSNAKARGNMLIESACYQPQGHPDQWEQLELNGKENITLMGVSHPASGAALINSINHLRPWNEG